MDFDEYEPYDGSSWEEARPFGDALTFEENQCAADNEGEHYEEGDGYISQEECIENGTHLTACDDDGYCNYCGNQLPTLLVN